MTQALVGINMLNEELLLKILEVGGDEGIIFSKKKFQQIIFLLKRNFNVRFNYKFRQHLFGPYSKELEESLSLLISLGYVEERSLGREFRFNEYKLSDEGKRSASDIDMPQEVEEILRLEVPRLVNM